MTGAALDTILRSNPIGPKGRTKPMSKVPGILLRAVGASVAATLSLAACADPPRAPIGYETDFEDYLKRSHAKAFAIAGAKGDTGPSFGMAAAQTSVEDAIDLAIARCEEVQQRFNETLRCRLWSIGDIDVRAMTPEQLAAAIALYRENPGATNDDL